MTTVYELQAFACWMIRKTLRLPLLLIKKAKGGLDSLAEAVYYEGVGGIVLVSLTIGIGFILGFFAGGVREEIIKPADTVVEIGQVLMYGLYTGGITFVVIFFHTCWYCFKQEQNELIETLKGLK